MFIYSSLYDLPTLTILSKPVNAAARGRAWQTLLVLIRVRIQYVRQLFFSSL
jgi:hypothetical protein